MDPSVADVNDSDNSLALYDSNCTLCQNAEVNAEVVSSQTCALSARHLSFSYPFGLC